MNYNVEYINVKYSLIKCFLHSAESKVLDVSYDMNENKLTIQVVLLGKSKLSSETLSNIKQELPGFDVVISELNFTKEQFNESIGEWRPKNYSWLKYLLYSKAEVLNED